MAIEREREIVVRIRRPLGATAEGAFKAVERNPRDGRSLRRLVNLVIGNPDSTEQAEVDVETR